MSTDSNLTSATGKSPRTGLWIALGVAALAVVYFISSGNRLVALEERVNTAWAQVETVLQRRFDLIPNLVATVQGYASHEKAILERVTELRSRWNQPGSPSQKAEIASELETTLSRLLVVAENYPDLKANQNFRDLQVELSGTENRVSVERQRYNEVAREFNTAIRQFPTSLVAQLRGLNEPKKYFEAAAGAAEAPKVSFPAG
ncbi:MAG: LemA family protein [Pirellulales bacterium]